jgi:hypothetical protein
MQHTPSTRCGSCPADGMRALPLVPQVPLLPYPVPAPAVPAPRSPHSVKAGGAFKKSDWGGAICGAMAPQEGDIIVEGKRGLCGFASTNLDFILGQRRIENIALAGFLVSWTGMRLVELMVGAGGVGGGRAAGQASPIPSCSPRRSENIAPAGRVPCGLGVGLSRPPSYVSSQVEHMPWPWGDVSSPQSLCAPAPRGCAAPASPPADKLLRGVQHAHRLRERIPRVHAHGLLRCHQVGCRHMSARGRAVEGPGWGPRVQEAVAKCPPRSAARGYFSAARASIESPPGHPAHPAHSVPPSASPPACLPVAAKRHMTRPSRTPFPCSASP